VITAGGAVGLKLLAQEVEECDATFKLLKTLSDLNNFDIIAQIIGRLPRDFQNRWLRNAADKENTFKDVVLFLKQEAQVLNSSFGRYFYSQKNHRDLLRKLRSRPPLKAVLVSKNGICSLCSTSHDLRDCNFFKQKSLRDRMLHMRLHKLL